MTRLASIGVVLDQRRKRLPGIEPAMGSDADPTLNRNWVGVQTFRRFFVDRPNTQTA